MSLGADASHDMGFSEEKHKNSETDIKIQDVLVVSYPLALIIGNLTTAKETDLGLDANGTDRESKKIQVKENTDQERQFANEELQETVDHVENSKTANTSDFVVKSNEVSAGPKNISELKQKSKCLKKPEAESTNMCSIVEKIVATKHRIVCHSFPLDHTLSWPVLENGITKMFIPLAKGNNVISFMNEETNEKQHETNLVYEPMQNKRFIRPVYVICANSDGSFDAPPGEENSVESAIQRISFNARILQTFTAENLHAHGFGRKTFRLEEDNDGNVKVNIFKSKLELEKALVMTGNQLYEYFHEELGNSSFYDPLCKLWVFMSCTRYRPPTAEEEFEDSYKKVPQYVKGHTALGGGNMALFGTGSLHNWARDLQELVDRFTDDNKINRRYLFDDSHYRGFYWANYSTSLGAAMHELGHTFNLPHTSSGIMGRGFDDMYRFFLGRKEEADKLESTKLAASSILPYKDGGAYWHRSSAAILSCCRWIGEHPNDHSPAEIGAPVMYVSANERGPLGGSIENSVCEEFSADEWLKRGNLKLKGFKVMARKYVNAIQIIGMERGESQASDESDSTLVSSPWFGNGETDGERYEFSFTDEEERLISIDVRAGSWIDAVRFHSSRQSSRWFGGEGGNLYHLNFDDDHGIDDIFGSAGDQHVLSIGIRNLSSFIEKKDDEKDEKHCFFNSEFGIRVVELRKEDGEVMKHWEYLEGAPRKTVKISQDELFLEKAYVVAVYDDCGECAVYELSRFKKI